MRWTQGSSSACARTLSNLNIGWWTFPPNRLFTPCQYNTYRNLCRKDLYLTCTTGRKMYGKAFKGGWAALCSKHREGPRALRSVPSSSTGHGKKGLTYKTRLVMPTCTPGLSKSLLMLVKYRIFSSLDLVAKMQGCDTRVLSVYVLKLNLYLLVSHLQKGISCILPPIFSMARTVFSELPQETLDLDHLKAVLISIWALGINKALSCFSLIVISGTSCHLCFAT